MSKMFDSLKRQIGRDAGKVVSNFVFGDSHSTPHRNTNAQNRANVNEINKKRLEIQQQELKQKDLYLLDGAVINAVNQVIAIDIPNNEKEITKILHELEIQLKVNKWLGIHSGEIAKIRNKFPDAVLTKYEQCVYELKYIGCNPERLNLVKKTLSKYKKIRFVYKYKLFLAIFVFLFLFIIVGLKAG
jgi:hypothetical protein